MDANLIDYTEGNAPKVILTRPVRNPNNSRKIIGHIGVDKVRSLDVAIFPRKKSEHWFRGESTSGLTGYGISQAVLDYIDHPGRNNVSRVLIVERDEGRVIEYDLASFYDATVVAYSPELNQSVIGDEAMRVDDELYNDKQRVVPVDKARQTFDRDAVSIRQ